ncbi:thioredoxin reductase [Homoserinimonas aerilata]|uniref:Thioredoxin reductase n=1 Tax=Homoserinimonas aerilata TaxID=1162970 RepID=A0A542YAD1_9MICO|nr:FAD-dependent oxidoreductase [Homoserinimonas aerilata]TQL45070.1 thioredoxin reductase [Homoserinimonas aerilata]
MTLADLAMPALRDSRLDGLPVAIIGAGPIGLAAAAQLHERGIDFVVYEAGATVASSMASWGHIRLFSPWEFLIDPAARRILVTTGWQEPETARLPTGSELVESYLLPLAATDALAPHIVTGATVEAVSRQGMDRTRSTGRDSTPFVLRMLHADGTHDEVLARAVIDASGTYATPNSLGSSGLDPLGLPAVADRVSHALPDVLGTDRMRFAGRHVTVVGAGHSAANTLLNLAELARQEPGTSVTWAIRNRSAVRVLGSADDELQARASLGARVQQLVEAGEITVIDRFEIASLEDAAGRIRVIGTRDGNHFETDVIVNAAGFRPNLDLLREIRLNLDDIVEAPRALAPLIDPNVHSCGTVEPHGFAELQQPEPNFFIAGMKSYGRAPTFLLATGYEQVRSIAAWLAGDETSARAVQLTLPATGVCSTSSTAGCC